MASTALNVTFLKTCLSDALQVKNIYIHAENITDVHDFTKLILQSLELSYNHLNYLANPVLYVLWYPDFRKYALLVPDWIKKAFEKTEEVSDENFTGQY